MYVINPKENTPAAMTYSSQGELITFRYRGLHTNPSAWIKKKDSQKTVFLFWQGQSKARHIHNCLVVNQKSRPLIDG